MKNQKEQNTEYLFRAIGEVDDRLLQQALQYRKKRIPLWSVLPIAAALVLSVSLIGASVLLALQKKDNREPASSQPEQQYPCTLEQILLDCRGRFDYAVPDNEESIPFFDDNSYIVWQYTDSSALYISRALTQAETETLADYCGTGQRLGEASTPLSCRIWIVGENGIVRSPYLEQSAGNTAVGQLFDYEAELIPSDTLTSCISDILK